MNSASLLPARVFEPGLLPACAVADGRLLNRDDPAVLAITDFTREHPLTVDAERQIDAALQHMIRFGVRALLVVREQRVVGLITSYDIQGERPLQFLQNSNYRRHEDIRVEHVMTPWAELTAVDWRSVESASAGDLLELVQLTGLTHLIAVEKRNGEAPFVRALISRTRLERQIRRHDRPGSGLQPGDGGDARDRHQQGAAQMHPDRR